MTCRRNLPGHNFLFTRSALNEIRLHLPIAVYIMPCNLAIKLLGFENAVFVHMEVSLTRYQ